MRNILINFVTLLFANIAIAEPSDGVTDTHTLYTNSYGYSIHYAVINVKSDTYNNPPNIKKIAIFGDDDRENLFADEERYFKFIQLVENEFGFVGTGFITGKNCDVLVTSGHNLYDGDIFRDYIRNKIKSPGKRVSSLKYLPDPNSNDYIEATVINYGFKNGNYKTNGDDWAVLRLRKSAYQNCNKNIELDFTNNSCSDAFLVGYHSDSLYKKLISFCKFKSIDDVTFRHYCDAKGGSSGGHLFAEMAV